MGVEKLSKSEIVKARSELEVEQKLPKVNKLIAELAAPYMVEASSLAGRSKAWVVGNEQVDKLGKNIQVVESNLVKLKKLLNIDECLAKFIERGMPLDKAKEKYLKTFYKHVKGIEDFENYSEDELKKFLTKEQV